MLESYLEDVFGKRFIIKQRNEIRPGKKQVKALRFLNEEHAYQFISRLKVPEDFWQKIVSNSMFARLNAYSDVNKFASKLLYSNKLYVFELFDYARNKQSVQPLTINKDNGDTYSISHVSSVLTTPHIEPLELLSGDQVEKVLNDINLNDEQLKQYVKQLDLGVISSDKAELKSKLSEAIISGVAVIYHQKRASIPPERKTEEAPAQVDKPVELSPVNTVSAPQQSSENDPLSHVDQKSQAETLESAAENGTPLCEECEKGKAA